MIWRRLVSAAAVLLAVSGMTACSDPDSGALAAKPTAIPASNFEIIPASTAKPPRTTAAAKPAGGNTEDTSDWPVEVGGAVGKPGGNPGAVKAPPSGTWVYTIQSGDRWSKLLANFKVSEEQMLQVNGLQARPRLVVGATLKVPGTPPPVTIPARCKIVYTVVRGDTWGRIVRKSRMDEAELLKVNNLTARPPRLVAGMKFLFLKPNCK